MHEFVQRNVESVLCVLLLVARIADVGSTWLVTPRLLLETNPIARRLGWPFALATLLACLVPYLEPAIAMAMLPPFLLVSAANVERAWAVRAVGEAEHFERLRTLVASARTSRIVAANVTAAALTILCGATLMAFSHGPLLLSEVRDAVFEVFAAVAAWWFGFGIVAYGLTKLVYGTLFVLRLRRERAAGGQGRT